MTRIGRDDHAGPAPRLAAIDVGTNSIRLIVAEAVEPGTFRILDDEKVVTRLGRGAERSGRLAEAAMEESAVAVARLKAIAEGYGVARLRAVATCAVREAANGTAFAELVQARAGIPLEVISPEDEARLAFRSARRSFDLRGLNAAVVDIGGGSTEIVLSCNGLVDRIDSLPLGAVRLTERYACAERIGARRLCRLRRGVRSALRERVRRPPVTPQLIIGTGGTFTTLAAMSIHRGMRSSAGDLLPFTVRGHELNRSEVRHLLDHLRKLPLRERARVPGLSSDRADIIVAGLAIVDGVMRRLGVNTIRVHDQGIRGGLLLELAEGLFPGQGHDEGAPPDRLRAARAFAETCRADRPHAEHVTALALRIFDQLAATLPAGERRWMTPANRELLEAAAVLHDIGCCISYERHHEHSHHLVVHSDLPGFTRRELQIVALVSRYHRRARPRKRHAAYASLARRDRRLVRRLAGILRLADGLDRAHAQRVRDVRLSCRRGVAQLTVEAAAEPVVDLWGAERKRRLFERAFGLDVRLAWAQTGAGSAELEDAPRPRSLPHSRRHEPTGDPRRGSP